MQWNFLYVSKTPFGLTGVAFSALRQSIVCKYYLLFERKVLLYLSTVYISIYFLLHV